MTRIRLRWTIQFTLCFILYTGFSSPLDAGTTFIPVKSFLNAHGLTSLKAYTEWMQSNIIYIQDSGGDYWQNPLETLHKRSGDCEDLAFLNQEVLKVFGISSRVLAHGQGKQAHVYAVFKVSETYYAFDNITLANTHMPTLLDMAQYLEKKENAEYLLELTFDPRNIRLLFMMDSLEGSV